MSHTIGNFYTYSELLSAGAQPSITDLQVLAQQGFEVVINISPASARNALQNEALVVEQLTMDYIHFPVDCSNLREVHYTFFKQIMNAVTTKKAFVHCGGNIKSSNLLHMYSVLELAVDEQESLSVLRKMQNPEPKWFAYFKKMGMKGIE